MTKLSQPLPNTHLTYVAHDFREPYIRHFPLNDNIDRSWKYKLPLRQRISHAIWTGIAWLFMLACVSVLWFAFALFTGWVLNG